MLSDVFIYSGGGGGGRVQTMSHLVGGGGGVALGRCARKVVQIMSHPTLPRRITVRKDDPPLPRTRQEGSMNKDCPTPSPKKDQCGRSRMTCHPTTPAWPGLACSASLE